MEELRFDNQVAVVTGGAQGIGAAFAELLAKRGASVVINDIDRDEAGSSKAEMLAVAFREKGYDAVANGDGVETRAGAKAIIETALDFYGGVSIVIHNAGSTSFKPFEEITHEDYQAQLNVHAIGAFGVFQAAWPYMKKQAYGRLLAITSGSGYYGHASQAHYGSAKTAQIGLVRVLAAEGAPSNIHANALGVGAYTRMLHRVFEHDPATLAWWREHMTPEVVAAAGAYLCHPRCTVTGEIYQAVGPRMAKVFMGETIGYTKPSFTLEDIAENFDTVNERKGFAWFEGGQAVNMSSNNAQILVENGVPEPPPFSPPEDTSNPFYGKRSPGWRLASD